MNLIFMQQAAEKLGVSFWTVSRWARVGFIPSLKIGKRRLIDPEDIEEFIRMRKNAAKERGNEDGG